MLQELLPGTTCIVSFSYSQEYCSMNTNKVCIGEGTLHSLNLYTFEENSSILSTQRPFQNLYIFTQ